MGCLALFVVVSVNLGKERRNDKLNSMYFRCTFIIATGIGSLRFNYSLTCVRKLEPR